MSNEVLSTIVPTVISPSGLAPVAPIDCLQVTTSEDAFTDVVDTVAVPPTSVTEPNELAPAAVVVATLVLTILFPAVPRTISPLVAVIFPKVDVMEDAAFT